MLADQLNELLEKKLILEEQHQELEPVLTGKKISVYYELRVLLYLGVMLFTTGIGILIYKNIGDIGHLASITILFLLCAGCFYYAFAKAKEYTNVKSEADTPYYDYIVLLACLLFISVLGYLQFQYELFNEGLGETTLVTSALFFYCAYRFDHLGVLSLAITAFASFWSISVSPQEWYNGGSFETDNLPLTAVALGSGLATAALLLDRKKIKTHFTFTFLNFSSLIFLSGAVSGIFANHNKYAPYMLALFAGCGFLAWYAYRMKSFLFLLYAFIAGYIGFTYLLTDILPSDAFVWSMYFLASCAGFIYLVIRNKNIFKRSA